MNGTRNSTSNAAPPLGILAAIIPRADAILAALRSDVVHGL